MEHRNDPRSTPPTHAMNESAFGSRLRIRCAFRGREITLHAIADSGNTLRDYLTHKPVVVLPQAAGL